VNTELDRLREVVSAAEEVLAARENQMLTTEEWDALEHAVAAATQPPPDERDETFAVEDGALVRRVVPRKGQPYEHRCPQDAYEAAAHAIAELPAGFVLEDVRRAAEITWTEAAVAVAFLKERGCVVPVHGRKHAAAAATVFEDAMTEYHALYEEK
jgi:hypothetical protein